MYHVDKTLKQKPSTSSRAVSQHELDDDPSVQDEENDYLDENFAPGGIDTSSDDIYNVHNTNFKRSPDVKSLIPRKSPEKSKPNKAIPPKPRYNGLSISPSIYTTCLVKTSRMS